MLDQCQGLEHELRQYGKSAKTKTTRKKARNGRSNHGITPQVGSFVGLPGPSLCSALLRQDRFDP